MARQGRRSRARCSVRDVRSGISIRFAGNFDTSAYQDAIDTTICTNLAHNPRTVLDTPQQEQQPVSDQSGSEDEDQSDSLPSHLPTSLDAKRDVIISECRERISAWATSNQCNVAQELQSIGKVLCSEHSRDRPRLSFHNWFKRTHKAVHRELAEAQLASQAADLGSTRFNLVKLMNGIAGKHWERIKADPAEYDRLEAEYNDSDAYVRESNDPPRGPTRYRLKTPARSRRSGRNYIRKALEGLARYAEDNSFDMACYFADRTPSDMGGVLPEQLGTTAGVKFIATVAQKGFSGEVLQVLAQCSNPDSHIVSDADPLICAPRVSSADPITDRVPRRPAMGSRDVMRKSRLALNSSIRALIKTNANSVIKDKALLIADRGNIAGTAGRLQEDLRKRGVKIRFETGCDITYADLADYRADTSKLNKVYRALVNKQVIFEAVVALNASDTILDANAGVS